MRHRRSQYFAIQVGLLIVFIAIGACSSASESPQQLISAAEGGTVSALGGSVTIEIPAGTLSEDTEITISRRDNEALEPGDLPELAEFVFEPDGLTFSKPVQVSLKLPLSLIESGFRLVHAENPGSDSQEAPSTTPLEIDDFVFNPDGETATVTTTLSSFSSILVYRSAFFKLELTAPARALVGVPFDVQAVTTLKTTEPQVVRRQVFGSGGDATVLTITIQPDQQWNISGEYWGRSNVLPKYVPSAPPLTAVTTPTFTTHSSFTCEEAGIDFQISYRSDVRVKETWRFEYNPTGWTTLDKKLSTYESILEVATGECLAPIHDTPSTPAVALPTPTVDPIGLVAEVFISSPTNPVSDQQGSDNSSGSVRLANGMTVEVRTERWASSETSLMKKSWVGSVDILEYTLYLDISGETPDGERMPVEYQVFAVDSSGLIDWSDLKEEPVGADAGDLEKSFRLGWAGDYVVKGMVGDEPFEITVATVQPPIRYGILAEPGTWTGQTVLSDEDVTELAHFNGEWSGWVLAAWNQKIAEVGSADVLKNLSKISLERTDIFIEPIDTGVRQTTADGRRVPYEMIVPKALYEGTLIYHLTAYSDEDGVCGEETVTYSLVGTVEYTPHAGPWRAPLELEGTLVGTLPKLTRELPASVRITVILPDSINQERMTADSSRMPVVGPLPDSPSVGFEILFDDFEPNPSSTITNESTCGSSVTSIALRARK